MTAEQRSSGPVGSSRITDFLIARNPDPISKLPFLVRLPLGAEGFVMRARDTWPRTAAVYCHGGDIWPDEPDVVEQVKVIHCAKRGGAIDLVLDRSRENRSMFVFTTARGRDVIFWQSARTVKQSKPNVALPTSRAAGQVLHIFVDSHETYGWKFSQQQASTSKRALKVGDYAVEHDGEIAAVVERKSLADLVGTMTGGKLSYLMAALSTEPRAALVVEEKYSAVFKLTRVRPSVIAEGIAEAQVRFPRVPIVFTDTRALAQEWTYRFFGAAVHFAKEEGHGETRMRALQDEVTQIRALDSQSAALPRREDRATTGRPSPNSRTDPTVTDVRAWALANGAAVAAKGRIRPEVWEGFRAARVTDGF